MGSHPFPKPLCEFNIRLIKQGPVYINFESPLPGMGLTTVPLYPYRLSNNTPFPLTSLPQTHRVTAKKNLDEAAWQGQNPLTLSSLWICDPRPARLQISQTMARSDEAAAFFHAVYSAIQEIPPGKVTSYGHIARLVGTRK